MATITVLIIDGEEREHTQDVEIRVSSPTPPPTTEAEVTPAWHALGVMLGAAAARADHVEVTQKVVDFAVQEPGHVH